MSDDSSDVRRVKPAALGEVRPVRKTSAPLPLDEPEEPAAKPKSPETDLRKIRRDQRREARQQAKAEAPPAEDGRRAARRRVTEEQAAQAVADAKSSQRQAKSAPEKKKKPRGQVCPKCGKYFDTTDTPIGQEVTCYCGHTMVVRPPAEKEDNRKPIQIIETQKRLGWITFGLVAAALLFIGVLSFATMRTMDVGISAAVVFTYLLAVLFLVAAIAIGAERKRLKAELEDSTA